ncbi:hypothetical protein [Paralcaligenes ureilyticus]|uniref:Uncharacterized protein n=1 Tax=Paralcaligenes ureilyticus TaxID=627131 RepID=A0A4R3M9Z7_9BURK|nr:hypothetical protein [Paralcaligenes ureilyticus]TCT09473.1 hypothetical protein EDC26_10391 [Paralcaligenes ureilyticus]
MNIELQTQAAVNAYPQIGGACVDDAISIGIECGMQEPIAVVIRIKPALLIDYDLCANKEDMFWHTSAALQRARVDERKRRSTERSRLNGEFTNPGIAMSSDLTDDCELCVEIDPHGVSMAYLRNVWDRVFSELRNRLSAQRQYMAETGHYVPEEA